jgi:hypothetical protein
LDNTTPIVEKKLSEINTTKSSCDENTWKQTNSSIKLNNQEEERIHDDIVSNLIADIEEEETWKDNLDA